VVSRRARKKIASIRAMKYKSYDTQQLLQESQQRKKAKHLVRLLLRDLKMRRVLVEGGLGQRDFSPKIGGDKLVGLADLQGENTRYSANAPELYKNIKAHCDESCFQEIAHGSSGTLRLSINILNTGELEETLDSGRCDETGTTGSRDKLYMCQKWGPMLGSGN